MGFLDMNLHFDSVDSEQGYSCYIAGYNSCYENLVNEATEYLNKC